MPSPTIWRGTTRVFDKLSVTIQQHERVAILGPNGSGKTTLLKTINRELYPVVMDDSWVRILGREHWNVWELRKHIGIVSHDLHQRGIVGNDPDGRKGVENYGTVGAGLPALDDIGDEKIVLLRTGLDREDDGALRCYGNPLSSLHFEKSEALLRPVVTVLVQFADMQAPGSGIAASTTVTEEELRRLASSFMHQERSGHTLQPTALVHEVFLKLVDSERRQLNV